MSRRRRGRITVQNQPTKAGRFMMKGVGAIHASMGIVFVIAAVTIIIPNAGLFGLPFLLCGAFFAINGIRMMVSRNDIAHRVGYDIETDVQGETIVGLMDDVDRLVEEPEPCASANSATSAYQINTALLGACHLIYTQEFILQIFLS